MARSDRRWAPLAALALACNPTVRTVCGCDAPAPELREDMGVETAQAAERVASLVGERLIVRDDAIGTSWRAVEPGTTGFHAARAAAFDERATAPFRWFFGLDAEREDTKDRRQIEIAVTFMPSDDGPQAIAIELSSVGRGMKRDDPKQTRTFFACPQGERIHYARFSPGESPCHHVPLVPIVQCGCADPEEFADAMQCAAQDRTAIKKTACARDEGAPIPR